MAEININDYIRDIDGFIVKVNNIVPDEDSTDIWYEERILKGTWKSMIKKHSKNIIDLIEVGDYVNGMEIDEFDDVEGNLYLGFPIYDDGLMNSISEFRPLDTVEIKTILTKEQYEANCYKVKEEIC